jgi:hypothetical protein
MAMVDTPQFPAGRRIMTGDEADVFLVAAAPDPAITLLRTRIGPEVLSQPSLESATVGPTPVFRSARPAQ